ncbi:MAG TPA: OB-fold domain-containing protein [Bryobacteraceae bacterium]|nr:OB-fold domain-containing protein [Bryobacteraceae bacterium]
MTDGVVYTETVVWSAPEQYVLEAPYQIAIVALAEGGRLTARIQGDRVSIGDRVRFLEYRHQFPVFEKQA